MENYGAIVLAVTHDKFKNLNSTLLTLKSNNRVVYDIKGILNEDLVDGRL